MKVPQFLTSLAAMSGVIYPTPLPGIGMEAHARIPADDSGAVVDFWREAGPKLWFAKDAAFDRRFRDRFLPLYEAAAQGKLSEWSATAESIGIGAAARPVPAQCLPRHAANVCH